MQQQNSGRAGFVRWVVIIGFLLALSGVGLANDILTAQTLDTFYTELPDVAACEPGVLAAAEKEAALAEVNRIRRLHNLQPVPYDTTADAAMMQASLIIAANQRLTHDPPVSSRCYSAVGAQGAASSNIAITTRSDVGAAPLLSPSAYDIRSWLIDPDVPALGHRRWLLDPFLPSTAYGRVDAVDTDGESDELVHGAAQKVIYDNPARLPATTPAFVAYPYEDYPLDLFQIGWYWSFSVVADRRNAQANRDINFRNATVQVQGPTGPQRVHDLSFNNEAAGLANILQWQVDGIALDKTYQVSITNVVVSGQAQAYTYTVRLQEPDLSGLAMPVYRLRTFTETIGIESGETFALYIPPGHELPNRYWTSRAATQVQLAEHSPYVTLIRIIGSLGDRVQFRFGTDTVTLRIVESEAPGSDPLATLRQELEMPVYRVTGRGERVTVPLGERFALYLPPTVTGNEIPRIRWTQPQGTQLQLRFYNDQVLIGIVTAGEPGAVATVRFGTNQVFTVAVGE